MNKLKEIYTIYKQTPPPTYVIDQLILEDTITILGAGSNQGKTLLSVYLMLCLSEGKEFFGLTTKQMNVAYFDLEMTSNLFCFRLSKQTNKIAENLFYSEKIIDITVEGATEKFIEELKKENINYVIIDSYSQLTVGAEENSNSQQAIIMEQLYKFKRQGIGLLLLHHKRKNANDDGLESLRGGGVIGAGADTILMLRKEGNTFVLKTAKDRLLPSEKWFDVRYKFVENEEGIIEPKVEEYNKENSTKYQIIEYLKQNSHGTTNTICTAVGGKKQTVIDTLKTMVGEGILTQEPKEPKPRQRITYTLKIQENLEELD